MLFLVRHGQPVFDRDRPAATWELDPAAYDAVWALRDRLPHGASWYSSPEPKALQTAHLLTDTVVGVIDDLREHERDSTGWIDDFPDVVRRAFAEPDRPANPGWEPLAACRARISAAVSPLLGAHQDEDVVLVGHGTAWTVLVAELSGEPPDLGRWEKLAMPDVIEVPVARR